MRIIHRKLATAAVVCVLLNCCSSPGSKNPTQMASNLINRESVTPLTHQTYPAKNPNVVSVYTKESTPNAAYRIIGVAKVSNRNIFGMSRQNETINNMMKKLAASIGGDGVIDVHESDNQMEAKVIAYQKILL